MIRAEGVSKRFGKVAAVDGLSFELEPGESVALWGSNGAGKTTLIRCLLGVIRFDGSISIGGLNVRRQGKRARAMVGYVPQELAFHDDARLATAMMFFARLRGVGRDEANAALRTVGLDGHERKRVRDLSGGMKQRLALAIALLSDPPVIVLDEPTSNLDAEGRAEVVETLRRLKAAGKTLVFASHRQREVTGLADRVLVMERGKLVRDAAPTELWPDDTGFHVVRLWVAGDQDEAAAGVLRDAGHTVELNGHGLLVSVPPGRKGDPMSTLFRAKIEVRDFEVIRTPAVTETKS